MKFLSTVLFSVVIALLIPFQNNAQQSTSAQSETIDRKTPPPPLPPPPTDEHTAYVAVENMPRFPGCEGQGLTHNALRACATDKLLAYIEEHLFYPPEAIANDVEGTVVVEFVVERDGSLTNVVVVRDIGYGCGAVAKQLVEKMNDEGLKWTVGTSNGKAYRVLIRLPVKFRL